MGSMIAQRIYRLMAAAAFYAALATNSSFAALSPPPPQDAPKAAAGAIVEQGKFTLHKFEQPIGAETYEITRDADSLSVKMDFKFTDRGSPVPMKATFRSSQDLTPVSRPWRQLRLTRSCPLK